MSPLWALFMVVWVLSLAGLGYVAYQNYQLQQQLAELKADRLVSATEPVTSPSPSPLIAQASPVASVLPSNWKEYTNLQYNFAFSYPSDWELECIPPANDMWVSASMCDLRAPDTNISHGYLIHGADLIFSVHRPTTNYQNVAEYVDFSAKQSGYTVVPRTINNVNGFQLTSPTTEAFAFGEGEHIFTLTWIHLDSANEFVTELEQVVASFTRTK